MIINPYYSRGFYDENGKRVRAKALVRCDDCGKERIVKRENILNGISINYCGRCASIRNIKAYNLTEERKLPPKLRKKHFNKNDKMTPEELLEFQKISKLGNKNPNFNPNKTEEEKSKSRNSSLDEAWRLAIYLRDRFICCKCKNKTKKPRAHHLNSFHWDKENRYNLENGATLCEECHTDFHHQFGTKWNTKQQYEKWLLLPQQVFLPS